MFSTSQVFLKNSNMYKMSKYSLHSVLTVHKLIQKIKLRDRFNNRTLFLELPEAANYSAVLNSTFILYLYSCH